MNAACVTTIQRWTPSSAACPCRSGSGFWGEGGACERRLCVPCTSSKWPSSTVVSLSALSSLSQAAVYVSLRLTQGLCCALGWRAAAALDINPPAPTPKCAKCFEGPDHIWAQFGAEGAGKWFFRLRRGMFLPQVCMLKMFRISWGMQICMQKMKRFSDP